ncbi:MAG: amidophosphoribosyltransferase [Alphaproteobacteria bacterium]|nr:amidophosphoribosyltransferase [Alphaproteobacteria bacterium]
MFPASDPDKMHEECGVFGIYGHASAAAHAALGLHALQHRGQEAAGIVSCEGERFYTHRGLGEVGENFADQSVIGTLLGHMAIGHVRYSTAGGALLRNVQPFFAEFEFGGLSIGHNGNLTNANLLRRELVKQGCLFQSTSDTEVVVHLIARSQFSTVEDRMVDALKQVEGAYSLVALTENSVIGVRDPHGFRPLVLGRLDQAWILASETCALDIIGAEYVRDVEAGEMVILSEQGIKSLRPFNKAPKRFCIFEYIYFARPDSVIEGISVYDTRKRIGAELARESHVPADVVIPVPDSGVPAALGYAQESGVPFDLGIIRNHYVGRTFIEPTDGIRNLGVKMKHNANRARIEGKRVILVDDSIVRGTTSIKIVNMVRAAGAKEVHMRISSPPTVNSCFFGIDTPEREKLMAARMNLEEMARHIGVDSLAFISIDGLYRAVGAGPRDGENRSFCDACFTSDYPVPLTDQNGGEAARQYTLLSETR